MNNSSPSAPRTAVVGLLCLAACEEAMLLAGLDVNSDRGDPENWAARPTIIHNSDFRAEQVERLAAVRQRRTSPEFPRVEHTSPEVYAAYEERGDSAARESRVTNAALLDELQQASDDDLLDPSRHPWLRGRQLWLQVAVRGFWHPLGHVGDYYLHHGRPDRALALHAHAVSTAVYLSAPAAAVGMAHYSLACAEAVTGQTAAARASLATAVALNADLRDHASREPDLEPLRAGGRVKT
jgi:hypothetical protein